MMLIELHDDMSRRDESETFSEEEEVEQRNEAKADLSRSFGSGCLRPPHERLLLLL